MHHSAIWKNPPNLLVVQSKWIVVAADIGGDGYTGCENGILRLVRDAANHLEKLQ
jgi:hypothetical protein